MSDTNGGVRPIVLALRQLSLGGENHRRRMAKALHIGTTELAVMNHLQASERLTPREVGQRLGITTGSTTAVLDRIERAGYVVRTPNPEDRRSLYLSLTPLGQRAMTWVLEQHDAQVAEAVAGHAKADLAEFAELINDVGIALSAPLRDTGKNKPPKPAKT
ncbi:MarR family transcriptional regulator [Jatrophihabitans telluris]|uniref:MarR family transcriptional regulator n=1 Tax=Jatrophihabitans telluris TaxID=2038343 RepID=A0ABY4R0Y1_9ACTN|nr:MarR family transcriptional regulator [Jatrophihabitans telluris]UQX88771.1 MarR family transcriptional regulator [Jatrophihabitans telluris]